MRGVRELLRAVGGRSPATAMALVLIGMIVPGRAVGAGSIQGVSVTATRPVYPILIHNRFGPLLRVVVKVGKSDPDDAYGRNDLSMTSVSFALNGTDDLGDLQSLALVTTGSEAKILQSRSHVSHPPILTPVTIIGDPVPPAPIVTFHANFTLREGENVFWLSARLKDSAALAHRLAASCTAVATTAGVITVGQEPSSVRQRIGYALRQQGEDGVDTYTSPALIATTRGTLLCAYEMRWRYPPHDPQNEFTIGLSRSTTGGATWEPCRIIFDLRGYGGLPPDQNSCSDGGILFDRQTHEVFCFSLWLHGNPHYHFWRGAGSAPGYEVGRTGQLLMVHSHDDGRTWSKPENLTPKVKPAGWYLLMTGPQTGIQLADGSLVMPVEGRDERDRHFGSIMISRDHGANWMVETPILDTVECQAVQLGDGSIMLNLRRWWNPDDIDSLNLHRRAVYVTQDLGRTWRPHETDGNTLVDPNCNASMLSVDPEKAGKLEPVLLFANPHSRFFKDRTHHSIQVSFNDGRTWPRNHVVLLDEGFGQGYTSMARVDAGHVGIAYAGSQADVTFQVIALDELLRP